MERLTPERVQEMLRQRGIVVTLEQAAAILIIMAKLASIAVSNYLNK